MYTFDEQEDIAYAIRSIPIPEDEQEELLEHILSGSMQAADMMLLKCNYDELLQNTNRWAELDIPSVEKQVLYASNKAFERAMKSIERQCKV